MVETVERRQHSTTVESQWHLISAILTIAGIIAAAIGAVIAFGPEDGTVEVLWWTWSYVDVSELWAPLLMIGGGLAAALPMGAEAVHDFEEERSPWLVAIEALGTIVGLAAAVIGVILLF